MEFASYVHIPSVSISRSFKKGFTLIELIVALIIFATLALIVVNLFNPFGQITKGRNAQRERDLDQIRTALDTYYNDHGCYPTSLPFGQKWSVGSTVYMSKLPQDASCNATDGLCYLYQTDNSACPQWNVLYASLQGAIPSGTSTCKLANISNCLPQGYSSSGDNYCLVSGNIDCSTISSSSMPSGPYSPPVAATPTSGSGTPPTPTPTSPYPTCTPKNYDCRAGLCNAVPTGTGNYCVSTCNCACNAQCK